MEKVAALLRGSSSRPTKRQNATAWVPPNWWKIYTELTPADAAIWPNEFWELNDSLEIRSTKIVDTQWTATRWNRSRDQVAQISAEASQRRYRGKIKHAYVTARSCKICMGQAFQDDKGSRRMELQEVFLSASNTGCASCLLICGIIHWGMTMTWSPSQPPPVCDIRELIHCQDLGSGQLTIQIGPPGRRAIHLAVHSTDQWAIKLKTQDNTGSDAAVQRVSSWMERCLSSHAECNSPITYLPSRVVQIIGPQQVRLYESDLGEKGRYCCLSHCWGRMDIITTTRSNIHRYKAALPWECLPNTFRHAISFTFRLGYQFLWIDSLCIVQDDIDDWRHEGGKMAEIYSNAHLTLAAAASYDAAGGCFRPRAPLASHYTYPGPNGKREKRFVSRQMDHTQNVSLAPLATRGWALQERYLSPRLVHFTQSELVWECRADSWCECGGSRPPLRLPLVATFHKDLQHSGRSPYRLRHYLVMQYTNQQMTFETDVFPALQGNSKKFAVRSSYLAGLWRENIVEDLAWYSKRRAPPREWRAPTWSWASRVGPVRYPHMSLVHTMDHHGPHVPRSSFVKGVLQAVNQDPHGEILDGQISLLGYCTTVPLGWLSVRHEPEFDKQFWPDYDLSELQREASNNLYASPGYQRTAEADLKVTILELYISCTDQDTYSLVLKRVDGNPGTYERVGLLKLKGSDFTFVFRGVPSEQKTVHLI